MKTSWLVSYVFSLGFYCCCCCWKMRDPIFFQESSQLLSLEEILIKPLTVIKEFSSALQSFSKENQFPLAELDEAGAILQDVYDNICEVTQMHQDWISTTENEFRKLFLSPAKRNLIYVDSTLDLPTMLFSDILIFFESLFPSKSNQYEISIEKICLN